MMEDAKAAAPAGTKVVGVTVLTSLDERDLKATGVRGDPARPGRAARGLVASGRARRHRLLGRRSEGRPHAAWPKGFFVVPGVRLADGNNADQKRVITPRAAMDSGASILVIGRPISAAEDPDAALRAIAATL